MTREEAVTVLSRLINSGILDETLEGMLKEIADTLCKDDWSPCAGTAYCADCPHRTKN